VSLVACDANQAHFREGAFDLVVGRSVLHHLLDYAGTLRQCCSVLTPGGVAVFYEPVLEGKTFTTFFMGLMLRVDEAAGGEDRLTEDERQRIRKQIRHQMKSTFLPQDRRHFQSWRTSTSSRSTR
jgi:2-polyprenyl-3-methyl-5-hydroxy-6-metoxy-1,4-benzoquinol methylase